MNVLEFTFLVWAGALVAGFLGSLTGLGGGVVLVPLLTVMAGIAGAAFALFLSTLSWNILASRDARRLLDVRTSALARI